MENFAQWLNELPTFLVRLAEAAVILASGLLVLRVGRKCIRRIYRHYAKKHGVEERAQSSRSGQRTLQTLFLSLFNYVVYFAVSLMVLSCLGVDVSSLIAVAGVGGVAIGFGCQTLVKDIISGLFLWIDGQVKIGDIVTVAGATGTVENVALRTTMLRGTNGNIHVIPNGEIRSVVNMTRDFRFAIVDVTVAHGQDYTAAIGLLKAEMAEVDKKLDYIHEPPQVMGVIASDGRAATIRIECKCNIQDCWALEREIRLAALECWRREDIRP